MKLRFAPSPTGFMHVGNARVAFINGIYAKKHHATFLLRMDDTDIERSKEEYVEAIKKDLAWMGFEYHQYARQSERLDRYDEVKQQLIEMGRLYPCYETGEELEFKRKRQLARKEPPRYDRSSLSLTQEQIKAYEDEGRKPHWRFKLTPGKIAWDDLIRGPVEIDADHLTDPVLLREDGQPLYTFSTVVDDIDFEITHIFRGEDHVTNTAVQLQIFEALGRPYSSIHFGHFTLLVDKEGKGFSKRLGSLSLGALREEGIEPMALNSLLARLGTSLPVEPFTSMDALADAFDLSAFSRTQPRFDEQELFNLNTKLINILPFADVKDRLQDLGASNLTEAEWNLARDNINKLKEAIVWENVFHGVIQNTNHDPDFYKISLENLPSGEWNEHTWKIWTHEIKERTGRKGKELFMPLRQVLTGMEHGPEMRLILPLLGHDLCAQRLKQGVTL